MKNTALAVLTLLLSNFLFSQSDLWTFPPEEYNGNQTTLTPLPTAEYPGNESLFTHAGIRGPFGNTIFFTVDNEVYDKDGYLINYLNNGTIDKYGFSERLILPMAGSCSRYAILYPAGNFFEIANPEDYMDQQATTGLYFGIYDMDLPSSGNGIGDLVNFGGSATLDNIAQRDGTTEGVQNGGLHDLYDYDVGGAPKLRLNIQLAASELVRVAGELFHYVYVYDGSHLITYKLTGSDLEFIDDDHVFDIPDGSFGSGIRSEMEIIKLEGSNPPMDNYRLAIPVESGGNMSIAM